MGGNTESSLSWTVGGTVAWVRVSTVAWDTVYAVAWVRVSASAGLLGWGTLLPGLECLP